MNIMEFGAEMAAHSPCEEGRKAFSKCKSRKDVFELIGQPVACDYFLRSILDGWGPSPDDFESTFRPYINGGLSVRHNMDGRKILAQIWCKADDVMINDDVRWLILVGCQGKVIIQDWQVVKIFIDGNSAIDLECGEHSIVYVENVGGKIRSLKGDVKYKTVI